MLHRRTHPQPVEGCWACRIGPGPFVAPSATPTRSPRAAEVKQRDREWDRDMAAYRRLRADGLQPRQIDGCGTLEQGAETHTDVEMGWVNVPASHRSQVEEMASIKADMGGAA